MHQPIVLLGYMGSGKTTIGRKLSSQLSLPLIDLDDYICEKEKSTSVEAIFRNKGAVYFRNRELFYLQELLNEPQRCIIALGGGTPCYGNAIEWIRDKAFSIYLQASVDTLYQRLKSNKNERPLIQHLADDELKEFIAKHLLERNPYYTQANVLLQVDGKSVETIVEIIIQHLRHFQIKTGL